MSKFLWILFFLLQPVAFAQQIKEGGNLETFIGELDQYQGLSKLFNCEVLIEKIEKPEHKLYWISIFDKVRSREWGFELRVPRQMENAGKSGRYVLTSKHDGVIKTLIWTNDYYLRLSSLEVREIVLEPFNVIENIKCAVHL